MFVQRASQASFAVDRANARVSTTDVIATVTAETAAMNTTAVSSLSGFYQVITRTQVHEKMSQTSI